MWVWSEGLAWVSVITLHWGHDENKNLFFHFQMMEKYIKATEFNSEYRQMQSSY